MENRGKNTNKSNKKKEFKKNKSSFKKDFIKKNNKFNKKPENKIETVKIDLNTEQVEMLKNGSLTDKIDLISLLCVKTANTEEFNGNMKNLLSFCENQHNDTIYYALKNIKDILLNVELDSIDTYITNRIIKTFENYSKNKYIGAKVLILIEKLIDSDVYTDDFICIIVNLLNTYRSKYLQNNFERFKKEIIFNAEDFFHKNDNYRSQANVLKFLLDKKDPEVFEFVNGIYVDDKYTEVEKDILYERIIKIIYNNIKNSSQTTFNLSLINYMRNYTGKSCMLYLYIVKVLFVTKDKYCTTFILKNSVKIAQLCSSDKNKEIEFIQEIYKCKDVGLVYSLTNNCYAFSTSFILGMLMLCSKNDVKPFALFTLAMHWDEKVSAAAQKFINNEKLTEIDPYDRING